MTPPAGAVGVVIPDGNPGKIEVELRNSACNPFAVVVVTPQMAMTQTTPHTAPLLKMVFIMRFYFRVVISVMRVPIAALVPGKQNAELREGEAAGVHARQWELIRWRGLQQHVLYVLRITFYSMHPYHVSPRPTAAEPRGKTGVDRH